MAKRLFVPGLIALLLAVALLSLALGSSGLSVGETIAGLTGRGSAAQVAIVRHVRLPRLLAGLLAGGALAVSGVLIQGVLSNPLAGPNFMGVNSGAGLAAILCAALLPGRTNLVPGAAFLGALAASLLVFALARRTGASRITLVLAGVAISSILSALIDAVATVYPDALLNANAFLVGGFSGVTLSSLRLPGALIAIGLALAWGLHQELDVLSLGEEVALSLGLPVRRYRLALLTISALLAGAAVSFAGLLGFVGLMTPHIARQMVGGGARGLIPVSALLGAVLVAGCDLLARLVFAPYEFPVGIVLSLLGGPFFLTLLLRQRGGRTG